MYCRWRGSEEPFIGLVKRSATHPIRTVGYAAFFSPSQIGFTRHSLIRTNNRFV